ncbi:MAG: hypothetical protein ACJA09_001273 [Alcanivorax sp.]|jgi:hypothetical protein
MKSVLKAPSANDEEVPTPNVTVLQVMGSVAASFFGVQSSKSRKRDFQYGKAKTFITVGILMTVVWYLTIYLVVTLVLRATSS